MKKKLIVQSAKKISIAAVVCIGLISLFSFTWCSAGNGLSDLIVGELDNLLIPTVIPEVTYEMPFIFPTVIASLFGLYVSITLVRLLAKLL